MELRLEAIVEDNKFNHTEEIPSFPIEIFPAPLMKIIVESNKALTFPMDFIASSMLFATSIAMGNKFRIRIARGYEENAVIYIGLVGRPGVNKSAPLRWALKPLFEYDRKLFAEFQKQMEVYNKTIKTLRADHNTDKEEPPRPVLKKTIVSDFTQEALGQMHNDNPLGLGVYVDELVGWFRNFNRYNSGNEKEFWLQVFSGTPINVNRKTSAPISVPFPFISVGGTIQPRVLKEFGEAGKNDNGFIDRFLFVVPDNLKKPKWSEVELADEEIENWSQYIANIVEIEYKLSDDSIVIPHVLPFSKSAKKLYIEWQNSYTDYINSLEDEKIASLGSKIEIYLARFALIMQIMKGAVGEGIASEIDEDSLWRAIKLIQYFQNSNLKAHALIDNDDPLKSYPGNFQKLYEQLPDSFRTHQGVAMAKDFGISERNFKRLLHKNELFKREQQGLYFKLL